MVQITPPRGALKIRWLISFLVICISKHPTTIKNHLHSHTFLPKTLHDPNIWLTVSALELAKPLNDAQMSGSFFIRHDNNNTV